MVCVMPCCMCVTQKAQAVLKAGVAGNSPCSLIDPPSPRHETLGSQGERENKPHMHVPQGMQQEERERGSSFVEMRHAYVKRGVCKETGKHGRDLSMPMP